MATTTSGMLQPVWSWLEKKNRGSRLKEQLNLTDLLLDEYEEKLLDRVVMPDSIEVQLEDVFGLDDLVTVLALAKRANCRLINIAPSAINSKHFGDANRLVKATFALARKLQPCIIFMDEVDALLSHRGSLTEYEGSLQIKNEFLALWDGLDSDANTGVLVLGTTNRVGSMDEAALRRFSLLPATILARFLGASYTVAAVSQR